MSSNKKQPETLKINSVKDEALFWVRLINSLKMLPRVSYLFAAMFYLPMVSANPSGIAAFDNNDLISAKKLFHQSIEQNNKDAVALQYLGKIALAEGELDDAEEYIEKAQKLSPKDAEVQFDTARIMGAQAQDASIFSAAGYASKSLEAFKKAAQLEPDSVKYRRGLMNFYLQAPGIVGGDDKLAMDEALAISELNPIEGFVALASVYQNTKEEQKLQLLYQSAEKEFPNSAQIAYSRGMYYQSLEKFELAIADFRNVQTMQAENEEDVSIFAALYQIGRNSVLSKTNTEEGIKALHRFINTAPTHNSLPSIPWAKFRLGLLYVNKGDKESARKLYKEAKTETNDKTLQKKLKKKLRRLR